MLFSRGRLSLPTVALPLSPSFTSPPPSLRSGTSPAGGLISLFGVCPPSFRHRLRRSLHNGGHKSGWVRFCAVSANAVRLAFSLGRAHLRSFSTATHGGTTLRRVDTVDFAALRPPCPPSYASHPPSSAQLHSLRAPSFARSKSGVRHCYAEPGVICAVSANAVRLPPNWP